MSYKKLGLSDVELEEMVRSYDGVGKDYAVPVNYVSNNNINHLIQNSSINQRVYLLHHLIKRVKKGEYIKICSNDMEEALCGDDCVYNTLLNALNKGVKLKIVLKKRISDNDLDLFKGLDNVEIYKQKYGLLGDNFGFLISGDSAFYIDFPHSKNEFKNDKVDADVNFNKKNNTERIDRSFSTLVKGSERVC